VYSRHGTGSHFVTKRPSDPGIQRPGDPVDTVILFCNELQCRLTLQTNVCNEWARGLPVFITVRRLHASGKENFEDQLLNVNGVSMTDGRIFTKISVYLYIFILGFFSKTGKTRVSHRVKMMTRWIGRERWPKRPIDPVTQWPSSTSGVQWQEVNSWVQTGRAVCVVQCGKSTAQICYTCSKKIIIYRLSFRKASRVCLVLCSLKWRIGAAHIVGLCGAQSNAGPKKTLKFRSTCMYRPTEKSWFY